MSGDLFAIARQTDIVWSALPATYDSLVSETGLTLGMLRHRVRIMRAENMCHVGGWKRITGKGGSFQPIMHRGPGVE